MCQYMCLIWSAPILKMWKSPLENNSLCLVERLCFPPIITVICHPVISATSQTFSQTTNRGISQKQNCCVCDRSKCRNSCESECGGECVWEQHTRHCFDLGFNAYKVYLYQGCVMVFLLYFFQKKKKKKRNKLRYLFMLLGTSDPRCAAIEHIDAQWSLLYCCACCLLNFRDANNVPCSVCSFFRHSGHGSCVQVLPHLLRTTKEPCPRPPFLGNLGIEGVEPLDELHFRFNHARVWSHVKTP